MPSGNQPPTKKDRLPASAEGPGEPAKMIGSARRRPWPAPPFHRRWGWFLATLLLLLLGETPCPAHTLRLADSKVVPLAEMVADLRQARVVLIGEEHDKPHHHQAQLQLIKALEAAGAKVAVGLEMFRSDSQPALDQWVAGRLEAAEFRRIAEENWGGSRLYEEIYRHARDRRLPLIGLNFSRRISHQVATQGFTSLSKELLGELPWVQCVLSPNYREFIERALGRHHRPGTEFEHFCEAQLLWDSVMARNLHQYLAKHPERTVVVLAGDGHAWKPAIPAQLAKLGVSGWRVVLPDIPGRADRSTISAADADYLLLGTAEGPIH